MTKKIITVAELKNWLNGVSDDYRVRLSINYDNCDHIQDLNDVEVYGTWLILSGSQN